MSTEQTANITQCEPTIVIPETIHVNFVTWTNSAPIDEDLVDSIKESTIRLFQLSETGAILEPDDETDALISLKCLSSNSMSDRDLRKTLAILANDYVILLSAKIRGKAVTVESQSHPNYGDDYAVSLRLEKENDRFLLADVPKAMALSDES